MAMAVYFIEIGLLMPHEFHHPREILILIIASEKFQFAVAADEHEWRTILANPIEGRILVDGGLERREALHLAHIVMGDSLTAERSVKHHVIRIDIVIGEPCLIQAKQHADIAAGRMTRHDDLLRVATVFCSMTEHPRHGFGGIVERLPDRHFGQQTVIHADHHIALILQACRNLLVATFKAASVEPNDHRTIL